MFFDDFLRRDDVAERFGHLAPLRVDGEAMRHHRLVRRSIPCSYGGQQRAIEPATMLVASFEVQVGRPRQVGMRFQYSGMADTGIEPYIQNIHLLHEAVAAALGATVSRGE